MLYYIEEGKSEGRYDTFLLEILDRIDKAVRDSDWLFRSVIAHATQDLDPHMRERYCHAWERTEFVIPGEELWQITQAVQIQYVWASMSPLTNPYSVDLKEVNKSPFLEDIEEWPPYDEPKHPNALVEFLAIDSSFTCVICREDEWHGKILKWFPSATKSHPNFGKTEKGSN